MDAFSRTRLLIGNANLQKLEKKHVAVFGVGGVGGFVAESLVRSGIGEITVIDSDTVAPSNLNRQIIATVENIGKPKTLAIKERFLSINPNVKVNTVDTFYLPENADELDITVFDYVVDAIDTVTAKVELVKRATINGIPVISCMGTGGKTDPTKLKVTDIYKTQGCPLARVMRNLLKKNGVKKLKVVYSDEPNVVFNQELNTAETKPNGRVAPPSMIFVPASAGILLAREVIFDLLK